MPTRKRPQQNSKADRAPLRDFCVAALDAGYSAQEIRRLMEHGLLQAAIEQSSLKNGRVNQARVALILGRTRLATRQLIRKQNAHDRTHKSIGISRLVDGWRYDHEFINASGAPRILSDGSRYGSFGSLAKKYVPDIPKSAVLKELRRQDLISTTKRGLALRRNAKASSIKNARREFDLAQLLLQKLQVSPSSRQVPVTNVLLAEETALEFGDNGNRLVLERRIRQTTAAFLAGLRSTVRVRSSRSSHGRKRSNNRLLLSVVLRDIGAPEKPAMHMRRTRTRSARG